MIRAVSVICGLRPCYRPLVPSRCLTTTAAVPASQIRTASRVADGTCIKVEFSDGSISRFHNIWLRDHCPCKSCRHPLTLQRTLDSSRIPAHVRAFDTRVETDGSELVVEWEDHDVNFEGWAAPRSDSDRIPSSGHTSRFPVSWLTRYAYWSNPGEKAPVPPPSSIDPATDARSRVLWGRQHFGSTAAPFAQRAFPTVQFDA
jgi:hypothetical protein